MERLPAPSPKRGSYKKTKSSSEARSFDPFRGLSKEVNDACDAWLRKKGIGSKQWTKGGYSNKSVTGA
tara:strand:+ start:199 stop:402 length:204 start_codon:yes stop_codon:yes gene_type:complete